MPCGCKVKSYMVSSRDMEKVAEKVEKNLETEAKTPVSRVYEVGFHLVPSIPVEDVPREFGNIKALIEKNGGVFISEDMPKLRPLAYSMFKVVGTKKEKCNEAYFGWVKFEANSDAIKTIKTEVESLDSVLRALVIQTVRENTLIQPKFVSKRGDEEKKVESTEGAPEVSPEAMDASIDKLVIE